MAFHRFFSAAEEMAFHRFFSAADGCLLYISYPSFLGSSFDPRLGCMRGEMLQRESMGDSTMHEVEADNPDRELNQSEFIESIVRIAALKFKKGTECLRPRHSSLTRCVAWSPAVLAGAGRGCWGQKKKQAESVGGIKKTAEGVGGIKKTGRGCLLSDAAKP